MDAHARDCVVQGFEHLIDTIELRDPDDRHVVAAAIAGGATRIVTFNLSDFPAKSISKYGIKAQSPDSFIVDLLGLSESSVCSAIRALRLSLRNPAKTADELLATFERQKLPRTVALLRRLVDDL